MAYTFGAASTDKIATGYTVNPTALTIMATFSRSGAGGGSNGAVAMRGTTGVVYTILGWNNSASLMALTRRFSGQQVWSISGTSATNTVYRVAVSHSGTIGDLPIAFVNGTQSTVTVVTSSSGSINGTASALNIGNSANDARNWAGWIAEFALYSAALDSKLLDAYSSGWSPSNFLPNRVVYMPLVRDATDLHKNTTTVTGATSTSSHPAMFNPSQF